MPLTRFQRHVRRLVPNFPLKRYEFDGYAIWAQAKPYRWRNRWGTGCLARWLPYMTGSAPQLPVTASIAEGTAPPPGEVYMTCKAHLEDGRQPIVAEGPFQEFPKTFFTVPIYLSEPGNYRYDLFMKAGQTESGYTLADFSVPAKDNFVAGALAAGVVGLFVTLLNIIIAVFR